MTTTHWKLRPTALTNPNYAFLSRAALVHHYQQDNERACREGVEVQKRTESTLVRTLQWNINGWAGANGRYQNTNETMAGIIQAVLDADADVIVLNEYHHGSQGTEHQQLEQALREHGYYFIACGTVDCPTAIATRLYVHEMREIRLSEERSALVIKVNVAGDILWIVGTHLDYADGRQRQKEMQVLIQELFHHHQHHHHHHHTHNHDVLLRPEEEYNDNVDDHKRMIIMGDLNQQRQRDYDPEEWSKIAKGMDRRATCYDDGVDHLLQDEDFSCVWDKPTVQRNWKTSNPPSTHWTGTVVDYSYGRYVQAESVSISPVGCSDHRMIVSDWKW